MENKNFNQELTAELIHYANFASAWNSRTLPRCGAAPVRRR